MTRHGEERPAKTPERSGAADVREDDDGRVPVPSAEEVPELLGERSDYPIPSGEERGDEVPRTDEADERPASREGSPRARR